MKANLLFTHALSPPCKLAQAKASASSTCLLPAKPPLASPIYPDHPSKGFCAIAAVTILRPNKCSFPSLALRQPTLMPMQAAFNLAISDCCYSPCEPSKAPSHGSPPPLSSSGWCATAKRLIFIAAQPSQHRLPHQTTMGKPSSNPLQMSSPFSIKTAS